MSTSTTRTKPIAALIAEKVIWQFLMAFAVAMLGVTTMDWSTAQAAAVAGVAAVITLALNSVNAAVIPAGMSFYLDLLLRVLRSAASAFLAFLAAVPMLDLADGDMWRGAVGAAGVAILTVVKGGAAHVVGNPMTAAVLPGDLDPSLNAHGEAPPTEDEQSLLTPGDVPDWAMGPPPEDVAD